MATPPPSPWLALLTFTQSEAPELKQTTLAMFQKDNLPKDCSAKEILFYTDKATGFEQETSDRDGDKCQVIDVPVETFNQLAPSATELPYLAHVREVDTLNKATPSQANPVYAYNSTEASSKASFAVVLGNRLLNEPTGYTSHLVSLENMGKYLPDASGAASEKLAGYRYIRLVSLAQWNYNVIEQDRLLSDIIKNLNKNPSTLKLPKASDTTNQDSANVLNEDIIPKGYVPLQHSLRGGGKTVSWYRGPLTPYAVAKNLITPQQQSSDALLRYNPDRGLFDISYAAAWQLGRLLALQNKTFAETLYQWKKNNTQVTINTLEQKILEEIFALTTKETDFSLVKHTPKALQSAAVAKLTGLFEKFLTTYKA